MRISRERLPIQRLLCTALLGWIAVCAHGQATAPKPCDAEPNASLPSRLLRIRECSGLGAQRARPWHARLALQVFDEKGKNPEEVTVEYWQSADYDRLTYTAGGKSETELNTPDGLYQSDAAFFLPYRVRRLVDAFLDPGPEPSAVEHAHPESQQITVGTMKLDCIMLAQPVKTDGPRTSYVPTPLGLFPTYCLKPASADLRVTTESGTVQIVRDGMGIFLGRSIPTVIDFAEGSVFRIRGKLVALATFTPDATTFGKAGLSKNATSFARISSGVMAGKVLTKVQPSYPEGARSRHASGIVVLHALIDQDGHIRQLTPVTNPDADLVAAALYAVRQWTYTPYLLNGIPTSVDTQIIVNFNISP